ncbi:uncharacterized protein [Dysidea avara]|uniref:uncharacterized protein n=1 Tax=Dysidea avara TaxID=196820 RepID=UPI003328CCCF
MASGQSEITVAVTTAKPVVDESVPLVLVSGASGYIATHTIQQLLISGNYRVRGTVRSLKSEEKVKPLRELIPDAKYPLELCEADLQDKGSWIPAVKGCKYVLHIASPLPPGVPKNPEDVIRPAVDGTLNVLSACAESGSVLRVVLTSSIAAVSCGLVGHPGRSDNTYSEEDWSPPEACAPYERSKTLAERAAWDFVKDLPEEKKFELVVMNPAAVFGPVITKNAGTTVGFIKAALSGEVPAVVNLNMVVIDVRDVAQAHIVAMEKPECNGKRYILVSDSNFSFRKMCEVVNKEFVPQGYKAAGKIKLPKFVAWFISLFNSEMSLIYPSIGKQLTFINNRMINELGIQPQDTEKMIIDTCYSLVEFGLVPKTPQYHGAKPKVPQGDQNLS